MLLWLAALGLALPAASSSRPIVRPAVFHPPAVKLQAGDLVFRRGRSFISLAVLSFDLRGHYSHVGVVVERNGVPFVVHTLPDLGSADTGHAVAISFADFVAPDSASEYAVYRVQPQWRPNALVAAQRAEVYADAATPFDDDFNLDSADRLYCTELVWRSYRDAGLDLAPQDLLTGAGLAPGKRLLVPSDLAGSRFVQLISVYSNER